MIDFAITTETKKDALPVAIYLLCLGIFAMVTSEFQVSGMIPVMADDLGVTISQVGYLVSIYAFAMAFGGPLLAIGLLKIAPKTALLFLYLIFICGEVLGALAHSYEALVVARLITGSASGAFFGVALAICVQLVAESLRGWAVSIVLAGIMVGTVLGLPMANLIGTHFGWRESFWTVSVLAAIVGLISVVVIPSIPKTDALSLRGELGALKNPKLWAAFATSLLIIGATFAAFTYFTPILKEITGYGDAAVAGLLFAYGLATVIGNLVVGKLAERHTISTLSVGLGALAIFLALFGLFAESKWIAALALLGIGLFGVTMNPAMVSRVMRTANGRPLINTIHTSVITLGIVAGSFLGGLCISLGLSLRSPLWIGFLMAIAGLMTLLPDIRALRKASAKQQKNA
ncbi:putative MFS family arabinose efflux permease [Serratia fonticola]|jgi:DHA1 family inner membrane transport protein|uniref:Putative MFS family arabinose efflux permease n=1 Tax=Serratia fonticola TaxID=47917 RepID=A0A542D0W1_SERFO|nr:MFS transporter [Serratia fonticola]TQI81262.1 putative MFS family arabinose efflux permease [Serratia fonticola]TQI96714.1 putative MFS family arabinose efflux permease [Serratia fonticola]TVZ71210.1 putative MFS family arabinose efflux permease [Serratia fonticola]